MRQVNLPGTDLSVSRFVFGTANLHHLGQMSVQTAHLVAAAAAGFTHFDTAPLYGYGGAEQALGAAFRNDPAITVTTKVGLYPPGGGNPWRAAMLARKIGGRLWPSLSRAVVDFEVVRARQSLEESLRRLGRDHVELLLLHEPIPSLLQTDEWQRWQEAEACRVQYFGVAGLAAHIKPFLKAGSSLAQVSQVCDGIHTREADIVLRAGRPLQLTYGYFKSTTGVQSGAEILAGALARNRTGAVLVSTRSRARLTEFGVAVADEEIQC